MIWSIEEDNYKEKEATFYAEPFYHSDGDLQSMANSNSTYPIGRRT